jgi:hypothetical protein
VAAGSPQNLACSGVTFALSLLVVFDGLKEVNKELLVGRRRGISAPPRWGEYLILDQFRKGLGDERRGAEREVPPPAKEDSVLAQAVVARDETPERRGTWTGWIGSAAGRSPTKP